MGHQEGTQKQPWDRDENTGCFSWFCSWGKLFTEESGLPNESKRGNTSYVYFTRFLEGANEMMGVTPSHKTIHYFTDD